MCAIGGSAGVNILQLSGMTTDFIWIQNGHFTFYVNLVSSVRKRSSQNEKSTGRKKRFRKKPSFPAHIQLNIHPCVIVNSKGARDDLLMVTCGHVVPSPLSSVPRLSQHSGGETAETVICSSVRWSDESDKQINKSKRFII